MSPRENVDLVPEEELYGLFARRRPDREAFRAGIEERIAARRAERSGAREEPARSSFWPRVAAFLPLDPLAGSVPGASLAKALGGKVLPAALALPALVLATAVGGFLAGARSLRRSGAGATPFDPTWDRGAPSRRRRTSQAAGIGPLTTTLIQFGALAAFLVTWLLGGGLAIDVLTLVLVLSMAALVFSVRSFARAGLLVRSDVTRLAVGILLAVFLGCFLWFHSLRIADDASELGIGWPTSVVQLGVVACLLAGGQRVQAAIALALVGGLAVFLNTPGVTRTSHASLRSQLASLELDTGALTRWREAAAIHDALTAVGAELPDLASVRARVARAMRSSDGVHPVVWTAAYHMGLVEDADWSALAAREGEAYRLDQLQRPKGAISPTTYHQYVLPMLLAARELTPAERSELPAKVLAVWPATGDHGALARAATCVRLLDELDRADLVASLRDSALTLLADHWVSGAGAAWSANVGGFTSNPEKFVTSFDDDTLHGVELMARFGVPPEIDLHLLRSHLRRESHALPLFAEALPYLNSMSRAALLRLREEIGMPRRGRIESVLAERLLIAALLIVILCLIAIRSAPAAGAARPAEGGAQP